jgi:hypothetical protein
MSSLPTEKKVIVRPGFIKSPMMTEQPSIRIFRALIINPYSKISKKLISNDIYFLMPVYSYELSGIK